MNRNTIKIINNKKQSTERVESTKSEKLKNQLIAWFFAIFSVWTAEAEENPTYFPYLTKNSKPQIPKYLQTHSHLCKYVYTYICIIVCERTLSKTAVCKKKQPNYSTFIHFNFDDTIEQRNVTQRKVAEKNDHVKFVSQQKSYPQKDMWAPSLCVCMCVWTCWTLFL